MSSSCLLRLPGLADEKRLTGGEYDMMTTECKKRGTTELRRCLYIVGTQSVPAVLRPRPKSGFGVTWHG